MLELIHDLAPQQERQPDPVVAPAARRRIHLRSRRGDGQGHRRDARADRGAEGLAGRVYELRIKGDQAAFIDDAARPPATRSSDTDEDVMRVFVPGRDG